ncbi:MAG: hypothetical protein R3E48_08550 [Burkholderiaceae bacterium]
MHRTRVFLAALAIGFTSTAQATGYVDALRSEQRGYTQRMEQVRGEVVQTVLSHPMASAALIAAGTGTAAILSASLTDEARATLSAVGILGVLYCMSSDQNGRECRDVALRLTGSAVRLQYLSGQLTDVERRLKLVR